MQRIKFSGFEADFIARIGDDGVVSVSVDGSTTCAELLSFLHLANRRVGGGVKVWLVHFVGELAALLAPGDLSMLYPDAPAAHEEKYALISGKLGLVVKDVDAGWFRTCIESLPKDRSWDVMLFTVSQRRAARTWARYAVQSAALTFDQPEFEPSQH